MTETSGLPPQTPHLPPQSAQQPPRYPPPGPGTQTYPPPYEQYDPYGPPPAATPPPGWNRQPGRTWSTRSLTRSRDDRLIAGVAGGVGRSLGVDPLILRVLLVVLAFFGGAGVLLYALGWLLLDVEDGRGRSLIEDAFDSRIANRGRNLLTVAALVVTILISSIWVLSGQLVPGVLLVLTVVGLLLYARRDSSPPPYGPAGYGPGPSWPSQPPYPGEPPYPGQNPYGGQSPQPGQTAYPPYQGQPTYPGQAPYPGEAPYQGEHHSQPPAASQPAAAPPADTQGAAPDMTSQPSVAFTKATEPTATLPVDPTGSHRYDPGAGPATTAGPMWSTSVQQPPPMPAGFDPSYGRPQGFGEPPGGPPGPPTGFRGGRAPKPPRQRREPSYLGLLTLSVMMLALGVLAVVDVATAEVPGSAYVALALGIVALGLLAGTWVGRSRGLIVAGVLLAVALVPTVVVDTATDDDWSQIGRWTEGETRRETPLSVAAIEPAYDVGSGRLVLDLREVDFGPTTVRTTLTMGAGEVEVLLPRDVDVVASGDVDLGELVLFGAESGGANLERQATDFGSDGASTSGGLEISIDVNVGRAEVQREAA